MATAQLPQNQQVSTNRVAVSIAATVGILLLIILAAYLTHRFQPKIPGYNVTVYPSLTRQWPLGSTIEPRPKKDIESHILDTIPVIKYDSILQPNDPTPIVKAHSLVPDTAPNNKLLAETTKQELNSCSICTEDFETGENVRMLPCKHIYHRRCIDPWLLRFSGTCPLW
jgi:Ring finger domain